MRERKETFSGVEMEPIVVMIHAVGSFFDGKSDSIERTRLEDILLIIVYTLWEFTSIIRLT